MPKGKIGKNWLDSEVEITIGEDGTKKICGLTVFGERIVFGKKQYRVKFQESSVIGKREYRSLWIWEEDAPFVRHWVNQLDKEKQKEAKIHKKDESGRLKTCVYDPRMDGMIADDGVLARANDPFSSPTDQELEFPATFEQVWNDCNRIKDSLWRRVALMFLRFVKVSDIAELLDMTVSKVGEIIRKIKTALRRKYGLCD